MMWPFTDQYEKQKCFVCVTAQSELWCLSKAPRSAVVSFKGERIQRQPLIPLGERAAACFLVTRQGSQAMNS